MPIVDKYIFTPCALKAIETEFPDTFEEPGFSTAMKRLQVSLILCHFKDMDARTKERARKTLAFLGVESPVVWGAAG